MSRSEKSVRPPLDVQLRVVDAGAALQSVVLRREAWLEASQQRAGDLTGSEVAALVEVGTALDAGFADVERHSDTLHRFFVEHADWVDERIPAALASGGFGDAELAAFARVVQAEDGGYASRGVALAAAAADGLPDVRKRLKDRISGFPDGLVLAFDTLETGCGLVALAGMGGLAMCPKTGGAGCALGAACLITLVAFC